MEEFVAEVDARGDVDGVAVVGDAVAEGEVWYRVDGDDPALWVLDNLCGIKNCGGRRLDMQAGF